MLNNLTNFFNLIRGRKIKTTPDGSDLIPLGTRDPRFDGSYQPTAITVDDFVASLPPDTNIYNSDGTLTGNRTVDLDGNTINFNDGKVGINTTNIGGVNLHVSGNGAVFRLEGTNHVYQEFYPQGSTTRFGYLGYGSSGSSDLRLFNESSTGRLEFGTSGLPRMVISASGDVGIGTTTPTAKLEVNGPAFPGIESVAKFTVSDDAGSSLQIQNGTNAAATFVPEILGTNSTNRPALGISGVATTDTGTEAVTIFQSLLASATAVVTRPIFQWKNFSTNVMTILANGNVGIGTTTPAEKLDVNGKTKTTTFQLTTTPTAGYVLTSDASGNGSWAAGGGAVNYGNVFFVDAVNGNNGTALRNDFTKPYLTINQAIDNAGQGVLYPLPTNTDRALVYVRRGTYTNNIARLLNYVDIYCEPGVVFINAVVHDNGASVICNFYGKAKFTGNVQSFSNELFRLTGAASKVYFEFDDLFSDRAAFGVLNGASATIVGRKVFAETFNTSYGCTFRGSGTITLNITEEIAAWHNVINMRAFSGKAYVTCPRLYLHEGNYTGGNFKAVLHIYDNLGGELTVNGDLIVNNLAGYYGGTSSVITRWTDSFLTVRLNGNIFAENQYGIYGLGSSASSRTIINGDVKTNNLVAYVASNSNVVFRNGTLMNWNNLVGVSEGYPVFSMGGSAKIWVENCHMYSLGTGATQPLIAAVWKDTTTSQLCINNSVHSGSDAIGFFIRNSAAGQPVNNVRIMNSRSTNPLDTNITDLLSPTGFVQDPNIIAIGFI